MPAHELTAIIDLKQGSKSDLEQILKQVGNPLKVENDYLQFTSRSAPEQTSRTHFARMVIIPGKNEPVIYPGQEPIREKDTRDTGNYRLLFSAIFDGNEKSYIDEIVRYSPKIHEIFEYCEGWHPQQDLYTFLQKHRKRPQIFYNGFLHETVESINRKALFRQQVQRLIDAHFPNTEAALDAIYAGLKPVETTPEPDTATPALMSLIAIIALLIVVIIAVCGIAFNISPILGLLAVIAVVALLGAVLIPVVQTLRDEREIGIFGAVDDLIDEYHEQTQQKYYPASMLTGREDVIVQNQFNLYLTFKGNWFARHIQLLRMIAVTYFFHRRVIFNRYDGSLAGLTTVHFGHWIIIDGGRRLFFMTNYDGSWENYIADFVNKIHKLLDIQLWSFIGFDEEGTRNITSFRRWLRRVQPQSDVFYSGYPQLTVRNISRDIEINRRFPSKRNNQAEVKAWLQLLGDPIIKTGIEMKGGKVYQHRPQLEPHLTSAEWRDIQSIIVYGYANLPHGRFLFLHIDDAAKARVWLKSLIPMVTTVQQWEDDDPLRQLKSIINVAFTYPAMEVLKLPEETLNTFSREFREGIAPEPKRGDNLHPRSINLGDTEQSEPRLWGVGNPELKAQGNEIHIMLIVYGVNAEVVDALLTTSPLNQIGTSEAGIRLIVTEQGTTPKTGREPFGFRDGVSNPLVEGTRYSQRNADGTKGAPLQLKDTEIRKYEPNGKVRSIRFDHDPVVRTGEFLLGYPNEYGQLPATPLVLKEHDPANRLRSLQSETEITTFKDFGRNGSYLVYRKLAQDVEGFWRYVIHHVSRYSYSADQHEVLKMAAKMVGRWPSGTPLTLCPDSDSQELTLQAREDRNNSVFNNFRFRMEGEYDDSDGLRCPFGSHIRRSHPRDSLIDDSAWESMRNANLHRIMRRSATFGKLPDHVTQGDYYLRVGAPLEMTYSDHPEHVKDLDGVGIHFLCVNANIQQQFEFIQQAWSNNSHFNGMFNSKDPLTGNHVAPLPRAQRLEKADKYAEEAVDSARLHSSTLVVPEEPVRENMNDLSRFVKVRGGAYLFIPGIAAMQFMLEKTAQIEQE